MGTFGNKLTYKQPDVREITYDQFLFGFVAAIRVLLVGDPAQASALAPSRQTAPAGRGDLWAPGCSQRCSAFSSCHCPGAACRHSMKHCEGGPQGGACPKQNPEVPGTFMAKDHPPQWWLQTGAPLIARQTSPWLVSSILITGKCVSSRLMCT